MNHHFQFVDKSNRTDPLAWAAYKPHGIFASVIRTVPGNRMGRLPHHKPEYEAGPLPIDDPSWLVAHGQRLFAEAESENARWVRDFPDERTMYGCLDYEPVSISRSHTNEPLRGANAWSHEYAVIATRRAIVGAMRDWWQWGNWSDGQIKRGLNTPDRDWLYNDGGDPCPLQRASCSVYYQPLYGRSTEEEIAGIVSESVRHCAGVDVIYMPILRPYARFDGESGPLSWMTRETCERLLWCMYALGVQDVAWWQDGTGAAGERIPGEAAWVGDVLAPVVRSMGGGA